MEKNKILSEVNPKQYVTDKFGKMKCIDEEKFGKTKSMKL
jgi:hypothetical protein